MPKTTIFVEPDQISIEHMKDNGGLSVSTKTRRKGNVEKFEKFLVKFKKTTLEKVIKDAEETSDIMDLENFLISFISAMKVEEKNGELMAPKGNTIKGYKSHIKCHIKKVTKGKIDISNEAIFEQFSVIYIFFCVGGYQTLHLHFFFSEILERLPTYTTEGYWSLRYDPS
jgi:hypothetical protein